MLSMKLCLIVTLPCFSGAATLRTARQLETQSVQAASLLPDAEVGAAFSELKEDKLAAAPLGLVALEGKLGINELSFWEAFSQALVVVSSAEVFDKTWFVTLLYSMTCGASVAFWGSFAALGVHTLISAALGFALAKFLSQWLLHMVTAAIFFTFAAFYAYECYQANPDEDAMESRSREAQEDMGDDRCVSSKEDGHEVKSYRSFQSALVQVYIAVFIAEWGDRTQVAMVSLHASLPIMPVVLGSLFAFFLACISAVLAATLLTRQGVSERSVCAVSAVSFFVFAVIALASGVADLRMGSAPFASHGTVAGAVQ